MFDDLKDKDHPVGRGTQQHMASAETLDVPFLFSSNCGVVVFHGRVGKGREEVPIGLDAFPTPQELGTRYPAWKGFADEAENRARQLLSDDPGGKEPCDDQRIAVQRPVEAVARGQRCNIADLPSTRLAGVSESLTVLGRGDLRLRAGGRAGGRARAVLGVAVAVAFGRRPHRFAWGCAGLANDEFGKENGSNGRRRQGPSTFRCGYAGSPMPRVAWNDGCRRQ